MSPKVVTVSSYEVDGEVLPPFPPAGGGMAESPPAEDHPFVPTLDPSPRSASPPPRRPRGHDGRVYALVDAYAVAKGLRPADVRDRQRSDAAAAFRSLAADTPPADVAACAAYLRSDPFWAAPGKLTARKVADTLPEWVAQGRPAAYEPPSRSAARPTATGTDAPLTGDEIRRRFLGKPPSAEPDERRDAADRPDAIEVPWRDRR